METFEPLEPRNNNFEQTLSDAIMFYIRKLRKYTDKKDAKAFARLVETMRLEIGKILNKAIEQKTQELFVIVSMVSLKIGKMLKNENEKVVKVVQKALGDTLKRLNNRFGYSK